MGKGKNGCSSAMGSPGGAISRLGSWLADLPADASVGWHEPSMGDDRKWTGSWMDVFLASGEQEAEVLTVVAPGSAQSDDDVELIYNAELILNFKAGKMIGAQIQNGLQSETVQDSDLAGEVESDWNFFWRARLTKLETDQEGQTRWSMPIWTESAINDLVSRLAAMYGREDLKIAWQSPPEAEPEAWEDMDQPFYQIGENTRISDQAFDQLLQMDGEVAATITKALQDSFNQSQNDPRSPGE